MGPRVNKSLAGVLLVLAAVVAATWPSFQVLAHYWNDVHATGMTHGWAIAGLVLWLLWRERALLEFGRPAPWALVGVGAAWLAWLVSLRAGLQIVHLGLVPVIAAGALLAAGGWRLARCALYPLGFFYFAIPLWGSINGILQWTTVYAVRLMLQASGVTAYFQSNFVHLPSGSFEIAGGCSGLHFFIVAIAVASLYARIHHDPLRRHLAIVAVAAVAAIILNWIRVYTIIVAGYLTHMQHFLVRVDHYWFGWALFGVATAIGLRVAGRVLSESSSSIPAPDAAVTASHEPFLGSIVTVAVLAGLLLVARWTEPGAAAPPQHPLDDMLIEAGARPVGNDTMPWRPNFVGASQAFKGWFDAEGAGVYVAVYPRQSQGVELGYYENSTTGQDLRVERGGTADVGERSTAWVESSDDAGNRWLVLAVYVVGERNFANPDVAQVYYALRSLLGAPESAAIAVAKECTPGCDAAREPLNQSLQRAHQATLKAIASRK